MNTMCIDQSLSNRAYFEQKCLNNIKKICQNSGKCDDQQKFKDILEATIVYTPEEITDDSPSFTMTQTTVKNQVLGNHCVYSTTYLMLKIELLSIVLELKNKK